MKITRSASGTLVVTVRPGVFPEYILAATALMPAIAPLLPARQFTVETSPHFWIVTPIALVCLSLFAEWSDFVFDPALGHFRWKRRRAILASLLTREGNMPLEAIEAVRVVTITTGSDNTSTHKVVIDSAKESVELTDTFMTGTRSRTVAREISDYLTERGYRPRFEVTERI